MNSQDTSADSKTLVLAALADHVRACDGGLLGYLFKERGLESAVVYVKLGLRQTACLRVMLQQRSLYLSIMTYRGPMMDEGALVLYRPCPHRAFSVDLFEGWQVPIISGDVMRYVNTFTRLTESWEATLAMLNPVSGTLITEDL